MKLTPQLREQIRLSILRQLDAASIGTYGLGTGLLLSMLRAEGMGSLETEQLAAELQYLQDKGFIALPTKLISPEMKTYRITADGRDFWAQHDQ